MTEAFEYDNAVHDLSEFEFEPSAFYLMLSSRKSGKSFMIHDLVYLLLQRKMVNYIYLFSATAKKATAGYDWIDKRCILDPDMIDEGVDFIMDLQEKNDGKNKVLVIFDDIDLNRAYSDSIDRLATRGRHYNITTILSAQITNFAVSHAIKSNSQYIFIRTLTANSIKKEVYSVFQNTEFEYPRDLYKFVKQNNRDYQFVMYLNDNRDPQDTIKVIKAQERKFKYQCDVPPKKQIEERDEEKYDVRKAYTFGDI
jgi:hypothetical protein